MQTSSIGYEPQKEKKRNNQCTATVARYTILTRPVHPRMFSVPIRPPPRPRFFFFFFRVLGKSKVFRKKRWPSPLRGRGLLPLPMEKLPTFWLWGILNWRRDLSRFALTPSAAGLPRGKRLGFNWSISQLAYLKKVFYKGILREEREL